MGGSAINNQQHGWSAQPNKSFFDHNAQNQAWLRRLSANAFALHNDIFRLSESLHSAPPAPHPLRQMQPPQAGHGFEQPHAEQQPEQTAYNATPDSNHCTESDAIICNT